MCAIQHSHRETLHRATLGLPELHGNTIAAVGPLGASLQMSQEGVLTTARLLVAYNTDSTAHFAEPASYDSSSELETPSPLQQHSSKSSYQDSPALLPPAVQALTGAEHRYAGALSDSDNVGYSSDGSYGAPAAAATWLVEQPSTGSAVLAQPEGRVRPEEAAGDISLRDYVPFAPRAATSTMGSAPASQQAALSSSSIRGMALQPSQAAWETASGWPEHAGWPSLQPSAHPPPPAQAESLDLSSTSLSSTRRRRQLHSSEFKGFIVQNSQVAWQSGSSQAATQAHRPPQQPSGPPPLPGLADSLDLVLPSPTKRRRRLHSSAIGGFVPRSSQAAWESISCVEGHANHQLHQHSADPLRPAPNDSLERSLGCLAREHWHSGADLTGPSFAAQPAEQQPAGALEKPATRRGPTAQCRAAKWETSPRQGAANGIAAEQAAEEQYSAMSGWTTDEQRSGNAAPPPSARKATAADCAEFSAQQQLGCSTADILRPNTAGGQHTAALQQWDRGEALAGEQPAEAPQQVQQQDDGGIDAHPPSALPARKSSAKTFTRRLLRAAKRLLTGMSAARSPAHFRQCMLLVGTPSRRTFMQANPARSQSH